MARVLFLAIVAIVPMALAGSGCGRDIKARDTEKTELRCEVVTQYLKWNMPCDGNIQKYIDTVLYRIKGLKSRDFQKIAPTMELAKAKAQAVACLLRRHPSLDSISITESCRGIRIYDKEKKVWMNVILDADSD